MIFFRKTEERLVTREMLLVMENCHEEYFKSITCSDSDGKQEFISGVTTIQEKWKPGDVWVEHKYREEDDITGIIMARVHELIDDPQDLATVRAIVEGAVRNYNAILKEEQTRQGFFDNWLPDLEQSEERFGGDDIWRGILRQVEERLGDLHMQEYYSLVWKEDIRFCVTVNYYYSGIVVLGFLGNDKENLSRELNITTSVEMKRNVESIFFNGYLKRRWYCINADFRLKMLRLPEADGIGKLREYFGAMSDLLQTKTVFESDFRESPIHVGMGSVYYPEEIARRVGTKLVEAVQDFGHCLRDNRCFEALSELDKVQLLQTETDKIKDRNVRGLTEEAIRVLNQNMDILKAYFDTWDTYFGSLICTVYDWDTYFENICCTDYSTKRMTPKIYGRNTMRGSSNKPWDYRDSNGKIKKNK